VPCDALLSYAALYPPLSSDQIACATRVTGFSCVAWFISLRKRRETAAEPGDFPQSSKPCGCACPLTQNLSSRPNQDGPL
jgi:hypothetical protein